MKSNLRGETVVVGMFSLARIHIQSNLHASTTPWCALLWCGLGADVWNVYTPAEYCVAVAYL